MSGVVLVAVILVAVSSHKSTKVIVVPATVPPMCAAAPAGSPSVTVYDHPSLKVGWIPAGWHSVSGTVDPPNNSDPLTFRPERASDTESVAIVFDLGVSAQQLPPPAGSGAAVSVGSVDIGGQQGQIYEVPGQPRSNYLEWYPSFGIALEVDGVNVATSLLVKIAESIVAKSGPPTVIATTTYLGPVESYQRVITSPQVVKAFPSLFAGGDLAGKLATYAEVRAAIGRGETGGTDAADGTPVWLLYNQNLNRPSSTPASYAIVDATDGVPIEGGSEQLANGAPSPASLAWIATVPDHQHISPCRPPGQPTIPMTSGTAPSATTATSSSAPPATSGLDAYVRAETSAEAVAAKITPNRVAR